MRTNRYMAVLAGMAVLAIHHAAAEPLPQDVVDGVALAGVMNREVKAECESRFPDLRERVAAAFESVPVNSIYIDEYVAGRRYRNPMMHSMLVVRREMTKGGEYGAAKRSDCEHAEKLFGSLTQLMEEPEKRDYATLLNWAAHGTPPTSEQKNPIKVDMEIVERMRNPRFWDKYPDEIRDRALLGINLVRYIQRAQYVAREIRKICNSKWPEDSSKRDTIFSSWPFSSVEAITVVNGRPYDNPFIYPAAHKYWIPQLLGTDDQQQEASCKDFGGTLNRTATRAELKWYPVLLDLLTVSP